MKNEQDPRSPTSGLNSSVTQRTPKVSLRERVNRHEAYWEFKRDPNHPGIDLNAEHYARLIAECDRYNSNPARRQYKHAKVEPDRVIALLHVMAKWAKEPPLLIVNSTYQQLADKTRQSRDWVKAALNVTDALGLTVTITKALKPPKGTAGRAPHRALMYLDTDGALAAELVRASSTDTDQEIETGAASRTDSESELVRTSVEIDAACRSALTNNSLHASLGATEPAIAEAGDGAHYSTNDLSELVRHVTAEVARQRGATTAQVRSQDGNKIELAAKRARRMLPDLPANDHWLIDAVVASLGTKHDAARAITALTRKGPPR